MLALAFALAAGLKLARAPEGETMFSELPPLARMALVAIELGLAGMLVSQHFPRLSALGTTLLLCAFMAAVLWELSKADPRPCGCFGTPLSARSAEATRHLLWKTVTMDAMLLAGSLTLLFMPGRKTPK